MAEHDNLFETVLDHVRDAVLILDARGEITYANAAANGLLGARANTPAGSMLRDVIPVSLADQIEHARCTATTTTIETDELASGRTFAVRVHPAPNGMTLWITDVTEPARTTRSLRDNEHRFRALFDNNLDGVVYTAPDGRVFEANAAACAMLGRTRDELLVLGRAAIFDPSDVRLARLLDERARTGSAHGEIRLRRADGTTFPAAVSTSLFTTTRGEVRAHVTLHDLTAVVQARESLELLSDVSAVVQRPLSLRETLDGIATALVPKLADLAILDVVHVLEGARILRHIVRQENDARAFETLEAHPPVRPTARGVSNVLRTRRPEVVTYVTDEWIRDSAQTEAHYRAGKAIAPESVLMVPMIARDKVVGVLTLTSLDARRRYTENDLLLVNGIAERAAHVIEHAALYEAAVAARERRDEVLGMVSHDLRGLLHAIDLNAQLLSARGDDVAKTIRTIVGHANRLVADLIAVTALESSRFSVAPALHPTTMLVQKVLELYGATARQKGIELVATGDCEYANVDEHRIVQALANLVGNAIKFAPCGSRVTVSSQRRGDFCVIEVRDEGPGIAPDELAHVFDRFWRGDRSPSHGLGLGLAIAKGAIEAHGGHIQVESTPGRGSCFSVWLPAPACNEAASEGTHGQCTA